MLLGVDGALRGKFELPLVTSTNKDETDVVVDVVLFDDGAISPLNERLLTKPKCKIYII